MADKIGAINANILASAACVVLLFAWTAIKSAAGIYVFCILYGFFSAGLIALPATVAATSLCPDLKQFAVRITMLLVVSGVGLLIGNPIAGAILPKSWVGLQGFSGALVLGGLFFTIASRVAKVGWALRGKC